ncbi:hypothetical protein ACF3M1_15175 [Luteimonas sp. WGS1318]|uniref:hypothetical protein n=1 Tax=Luteimonas sp. WGS1318 TaxID=3366815 RepID=UPI00372D670B
MSSVSNRVHIEADGIALDAVFELQGEALQVRYRLRNAGDDAVAVFDRGDRRAVLTKRQAAGAVGVPFLRDEAVGRVTLLHVAQALPTPSPTVPPTPLARRLDADAEIEGAFAFSQWLGAPPAQVRWCLGVAPFDPARLFAPETVDGIEVWQADFAFADVQVLICTPWFDMARRVFAPGQ